MNVQAGDLAVCIRDPNMGCFVKVLRAAPEFGVPAWLCRTLQPVQGLRVYEDAWQPLRFYPAGTVIAFGDAELRPIRGNDQADVVAEVVEEAVPA